MTLDLEMMVRTAVVTEAPNSWPTYDGKNLKRYDYITASESNKCVRELSFQKTQEAAAIPVDDYWDSMDDEEYTRQIMRHGNDSKLGIFARGHNVEAWVVSRIESMADPDLEDFDLLGADQISFYHNGIKASGTPDGIHFDKVAWEVRIIEFKSAVSPVSAPRSAHVAQVQVNMGLIAKLVDLHGPIEFARMMGWDHWIRDGEFPPIVGATVLYINPSNYMTMQQFFVEYDGGAFLNAVQGRSEVLFTENGIEKPENLPPEGLSNNGCYFCPFKADCKLIESAKKHQQNAEKLTGMIDGTPPKMPDFPKFKKESVKDVVGALDQYADARETKKLAENLMDHLKGFIKDWVAQHDDKTTVFDHDGNNYRVTLSTSERKGSLDAKKLDAFLTNAHHDLTSDAFRGESSSSETLNVTRKPAA